MFCCGVCSWFPPTNIAVHPGERLVFADRLLAMEDLLYRYELNPTTWVYLSSMLTIVIFFKFNRLLSIRNLDVLGLIALAPGLLLVSEGQHLRDHEPARQDAAQLTKQANAKDTATADAEPSAEATPAEEKTAENVAAVSNSRGERIAQWGYAWLFGLGLFFLLRLLCDPLMVRRPLLEPNLNTQALTCLAAFLMLFLMTNVVTAKMPKHDWQGDPSAEALRNQEDAQDSAAQLAKHGPGYPLLFALPRIPSMAFSDIGPGDPDYAGTARVMAILSHLAIVLGLVAIGYQHFDNIWTGVAVATLYLMLPATAQMVGWVNHLLAAAALVWAIATYRRPLLSGMLLGVAIGVIFYPIFLLPVWISFYWQRGVGRFATGVALMLALMTIPLVFTSSSPAMFLDQVKQMFGWTSFTVTNVEGFWAAHGPYYRIPVIALFMVLCVGLSIWPAQKNLGTLMSCSAAVMLGTQFWYAQGGLLYVAWYMPLMLLTVFRPNLEHRVALANLSNGWLRRRGELVAA